MEQKPAGGGGVLVYGELQDIVLALSLMETHRVNVDRP